MNSGPRTLKLALAACIAIASVSLVVNLLLARELMRSFVKLQAARIFPLGYAPQPEATRTGSGRTSIALFGDSRSYQWDQGALSAAMDVINRAHGAQTSSQLRLQLETTPTFHTSCALVQIGINDLHPLGALREQRQQIVASLSDNLAAIRDLLRARADLVILTTIFPPSHVPVQRRLLWDASTLDQLGATNALIRRLANADRVVLLDADRLLRGPDSYVAESYVGDEGFMHVNAAAYAVLNAELTRLLMQVPESAGACRWHGEPTADH